MKETRSSGLRRKSFTLLIFFFHPGLRKKNQFSHSRNTLSQKQDKGSKLFWQGQAPRLSLAWSRISQPPVNPLHLKRLEQGLASPSIAFFLGVKVAENRNSVQLRVAFWAPEAAAHSNGLGASSAHNSSCAAPHSPLLAWQLPGN